MDLIKCAHCGKDINPEVFYCPFCGGRNLGTVLAGKPQCPRCGSALRINKKGGMEIDHCPNCSGLWLDRGEFRIMTAESNVYREVRLTEEYRRPPAEGKVKYIPCVRCGKLMTRKNFGRISGVMIDECDRHGVWLDRGELDKIRHFIADGGLERSQDREIERNRQELKDLATTAKDTASMLKMLHYFNWKRWFFS